LVVDASGGGLGRGCARRTSVAWHPTPAIEQRVGLGRSWLLGNKGGGAIGATMAAFALFLWPSLRAGGRFGT